MKAWIEEFVIALVLAGLIGIAVVLAIHFAGLP